MEKREVSKVEELRIKLHEILFESDTLLGKTVDVVLLILIAASVMAVILESVPSYAEYVKIWATLEIIFTVIFTIEYVLRLISVTKAKAYAFSFFGIVDLLAILPFYLSFFFTSTNALFIVRALRLLRIFRILKLGNYTTEGRVITDSLAASQKKISVFLFGVFIVVVIIGALMYVIEGGANPSFSSIPISIYWAIVTLTTVGYGDISPITPLGQLVSALVMIIGYAIIAVPTGIITADVAMNLQKQAETTTQSCRHCGDENHLPKSIYCKTCGEKLNP